MCQKKIQLNDSFQVLGADLEIKFIFLPTSHSIKEILPIPFGARFSLIEEIIDCLQIEI